MSYGFVGSSGTSVSSSGASRSRGSRRRRERRLLEVVLRQKREQVARVLEARLLVGRGEVRDARLRRVGRRAAELLERDVLAGDRLHHVGAGDEHVRRALDHEHEVGDRGRVDRAAGAGPHHERDLRDDAGRLHVPPEDLRVPGERDDALLDPRAARVVDPDHRAAELDRQVHHLADLLGEDLGQRPAEDREVLREDEDLAAEDRPVAGDDRVAPRPALAHPELDLAVADVAVELDERARVEELLGALAREQPPLLAPLRDRLLAALVARLVAERLACRSSFPRGGRRRPRREPNLATVMRRCAVPPALQQRDFGFLWSAILVDALRREHDRRRGRLAGVRDPQEPARPRPGRPLRVPAAADPRAAGRQPRRPRAAPADRGDRR